MLREAGYYTSYKGKWHLSNINGPRNWRGVPGGIYPNSERALEGYGFGDYNFNGEEVGLTWAGYQSDQLVAGDAARLIVDYARSDKSQERPWFLVVNLINPHDIMFYDATGKQAASRPSPDMLAPVKREPIDRLYTEDLGYDLPESFYKDDLSTKPEAHSAIVRLNNRFYGRMDRSDVASWRRFTNYYYNCLRDVDRHLDTLLWVLDYSSQADNTVIMYTTDHGERAAAHGMRQKAGTTYKEETNVPMIIAHPEGAGGRTTRGLMSAIDIAPTLLAFAGRDRAWTRERYPDLNGVDVSPLVGDARTRTERDRRGHLFNYAVQHMWEPIPPEPRALPGPARYDLSKRRLHRGAHDGRYKFARYFAPAQHHTPGTWDELTRLNDLELYDTATDPNEINNLAHRPDAAKPALMRLNAMTNALVKEEVGRDDGSEYPGPREQYNTLT
jgi:arylsulfatase